jgi:phospholipase A-2-activating protein
LCKFPKGHPSGADFASAGNDGIIRLWELQGRQVGELHGHENFIYSLASHPSGDLISSGEDRTVRIWRGNNCIQTITHPAISVWGVSVCPDNGDIVSGSSDRIVRVFTRDTSRKADAQTLQAFEDSVKGSSIPQQQMGEINKEKLPGPEYLTQRSGTKEGQVVMIREANGSVTAHTWSSATNNWVNVGTVVDAVGSSGRKTGYLGKDYDYVFDVDIEDGKPPLKLPYNLSQNPYDAATKFIQDNELPIGYLDQVANFIVTNTKGATLGQSSQEQNQSQTGSDPWGQESRYRPGESTPSGESPRPSHPVEPPKVLPQTSYLSIKTANLKTIQKKIEELNDQLLNNGQKDGYLNQGQIGVLRKLTNELEKTSLHLPADNSTAQDATEMLVFLIKTWPPQSLLPILDLIRLLVSATAVPAAYKSATGETLVDALQESGILSDMSRPNNVMLAVRALANMFETDAGQRLADDEFTKIHQLIKPLCKGLNNRNLTIAITTLFINYAVYSTSPSKRDLPASMDRALMLFEDLDDILNSEKDSEVIYRSLVATGTLLSLGEEIRQAARDLLSIGNTAKRIGSSSVEPRIKRVVKEIGEILA